MSLAGPQDGQADAARRRFLAFSAGFGIATLLPRRSLAAPAPGLPDPETAKSLAFTDLDTSGLDTVKVKKTRVCELTCPTGRIVACDPLVTLSDSKPFAIPVPTGAHPVFVYQDMSGAAWGDRVGLAELRISDAPIKRWRIALVDESSLPEMVDDMISGYGVDAGTGCFADEAAVKAFDRHLRDSSARAEDSYITTVLLDAALKMGRFTEHRFTFDKSLNLAMYESGYGDGYYASYWGFDGDGAPTRLVTDFGVFAAREREAKGEPSPETPPKN